MEEVYRSDTIVVRRVACENQSRWVITFDNHSIGTGFDRPGFGEAFLQSEGISAVHVLGRGNDWYQYPDIAEAAHAVRRIVAGSKRRLAYGSSMGGYAAIRMAKLVRADRVLALSPQFTIDPAIVPWERRWEQDGHRISFVPELSGPIEATGRPTIVYDPLSDDRRHVEMIAEEIECSLVPVPYGGHPVSTFLQETGLLRQLVIDLLDGRIDTAIYDRRIRKRRRKSSAYLGNLAERQPAARPNTAFALARMSAATGGTLGLLSLARVIARNGDPQQALVHFRKAVELTERDPNYLYPYAEGLLAVGDATGAIEIARELTGKLPEMAHLRHWRAWVHTHTDDYAAAVEQETLALGLFPGNQMYAAALARYTAEAVRSPKQRALRRTWRDGFRRVARALGFGTRG